MNTPFSDFWTLVRKCPQFPGGCLTVDGPAIYAFNKGGTMYFGVES